MAARIPNTFRRNGTYYARVVWPISFLKHFPHITPELRFSLQTQNPELAKRLMHRLNGLKMALVDLAQQTAPVISNEFENTVDTGFEASVNAFLENLKNPVKWTQLQMQIQNVLMTQQRTVVPLPLPKPKFHDETEDTIGAYTMKTLNDGPVSQVYIDIRPDGTERIRSDLEDSELAQDEILAFLRKKYGSGTSGPGTSCSSTLTIKEVVEEFLEDEESSGRLTERKQRKQARHRLTYFAEFLGPERKFSALTRADAKKVRAELLHRNALKRSNPKDKYGLKRSTCMGYFALFKRLCKHAFAEKHNTENITYELFLKVKGKTDSYKLYTQDDLLKIFGGYVYTNAETKRSLEYPSIYFWLPLLGLYTGARLNELCQLQVKDIKNLEGIWYIDITCSSEEDELDEIFGVQSLKNAASKRGTPIHQQLIDIGFIDFFNERKQVCKPHDQLFDKIVWDPSNNWGKRVGRWYITTYLRNVQLEEPKGKVFHSYRHSMVNHLRTVLRIADESIAKVVGHEGETTTAEYGRGINPEKLRWLQGFINQVDFGIPMDHISWEKFKEFQACRGRPIANKALLDAYKRKQQKGL